MLETSFVKTKELRSQMLRAKVFEKDIKEQFVRSSGKGGQNVNKVSTCVYLHHVPTGISVKCQKQRSQALNRLTARFLLLDKIRRRQEQIEQKKISQREKKKRQQRKRSKKFKEKILEDKRYQSQKKETRRKIKVNNRDGY